MCMFLVFLLRELSSKSKHWYACKTQTQLPLVYRQGSEGYYCWFLLSRVFPRDFGAENKGGRQETQADPPGWRGPSGRFQPSEMLPAARAQLLLTPPADRGQALSSTIWLLRIVHGLIHSTLCPIALRTVYLKFVYINVVATVSQAILWHWLCVYLCIDWHLRTERDGSGWASSETLKTTVFLTLKTVNLKPSLFLKQYPYFGVNRYVFQLH